MNIKENDMGFFTKLLSIFGMGQSAPEPKPEFKPVSLKELVIEKNEIQTKLQEESKIKISDNIQVDIPIEEVKEKPKKARKPAAPKNPTATKKPRKKKQ